MALVPVYNLSGKEVDSMELDDRFFAIPQNDVLLKEVYTSLSANLRGVFAHTKGRGERAGSGKKPWKQKHTGRARAGSVRSPLWRKGGIVFGPKSDRNFSKKINQKVRRKAFFMVLSEKIRSKELIVVDSLSFSEWKTKRVAEALSALSISEKSVVLGFLPEERLVERAGRNIPKLSISAAHTLNAKDALDHRFVLLSRLALIDMEKRAEHSTTK